MTNDGHDASPCLVAMEFDTQAFGFPFYRVVRFDEDRLAAELAALGDSALMAADAKRPADDVAGAHALETLGFRKVCMQITLCHHLGGYTGEPDPEVEFLDRLPLDDSVLWRHARNFTKDRFSLDPCLPAEGRQRLYYQWFRGSLGGRKRVARLGPNVCTFAQQGDEVSIDLVSILEPRRGFGARIVGAVVAAAANSGASTVRVVTECENTPAWKLYLQQGFVPDHFTAAFHLVRGARQ
jgi:GNAT superfamily N-acetyltransferase